MCGLSDVRDYILGAGRALDIGEEKYPALSLELAAEFSNDTGLSHAPLPGQQHMVAILDQPFQPP